jgi:hypothetical protein
MNIALTLDKMTTVEKLGLMELIWNDLSKNQDEVSSPIWHEKVLTERENNLLTSKDKFISIEESKKRIKNILNEH